MKDYPIVIAPLSEEDGGGFVGFAPDLVGCMSDGESRAEALANVEEAILEWLDEARRLNRDIPSPGVGAAHRREVREQQRKEIVDQLDDLNDRLDSLSRSAEDSKEALENFDGWSRFSALLHGSA